MNEKDLYLMAYLKDNLSAIDNGPVLLDVKSTQFVRVNLLLLKAFSSMPGRPGMFIAVDRPHHYMLHLMGMHQIDPQGLIFIDAISRFAADTKNSHNPANLLNAPSNIDSLPSVIRDWAGNSPQLAPMDLHRCRFAMIDNISSLLLYNSFNNVEVFLQDFIDVLTSHARVQIPLLVDRERNCMLYEAARSLCPHEISVNDGILASMSLTSKRNGIARIVDSNEV
jgi:hypothetical protein